MGGGGSGGSGGGGGGNNNRVGSGSGNLRGPGETNRQRFNRQVNSRIRSRRGPNAAQAAHQAGWRGWSVGVNGSWSGGNIGDANSPAAKAYRSKHGDKAYKSMVKSKGYKGTGASSKSWSSIAFGDQPESEWSKIQNEWNTGIDKFVNDKVYPSLKNYLRDTRDHTFKAFTDQDKSQQWSPTLSAKEKAWQKMTIGERFRNYKQHPMGDMFKGSFWSKGLSDAKDMGSHALRNIYNPEKNQMAIGHQLAHAATAIPKAWASLVGLAPNISKIPGVKNIPGASRINQQNWAHNVVNATTADYQGLENVSNIAQTFQGIRGGLGMLRGGWSGLRSGLSGIKNAGALNTVKGLRSPALKQIFHGTSAGAAKNIVKGGINPTGGGMLGPGAYGSKSYGISTWYRGGLKGTPFGNKAGTSIRSVVPAGARTLRGATVTNPSTFNKGMRIAQKVQAGAPGAKAAQIRAMMNASTKVDTAGRGLRSISAGRIGDLGLGAAGIGLGAAGLGLGTARIAAPIGSTAFNMLTSEQGRLRSLMDALGSDRVDDYAEGIMGEGDWNEMQRNWVTNLIKQGARPALRQADDLGGIKGWIAGIQRGKFDRRTAREDVPGTLRNILGTYSLTQDKFNPVPGAFRELRERLGQFGDFANNRDVESIRARLPDQTRREQVRNLRESGYGTSGSNNQMRIQSFDPNKINIQANPYGQAQAATEESDLAAFWQRQSQLDAEADRRLQKIQSDQDAYRTIMPVLGEQQKGYTDELARIQPIGKGIDDELARILPIGKDMKDHIERSKTYRKDYADELERLKPFDQMFRDDLRFGIAAGWDRPDRYGKRRSGDSWDREGKLTHGGISGRDFIAQNMRWYSGTKTPETTKILKEYEDYLTGVENLQKWQKENETNLGQLESNYKDYQDHLSGIQTQQKEYQDYLSQLQTEQRDLTSYSTDVSRRSKQLDDYAALFSSARQASDEAAKSYTIRSQQSISSGLRPGVSGIRAARGFSSYGGRNRNRSAKRRFNRDFRIGSFGDEARIQPINV